YQRAAGHALDLPVAFVQLLDRDCAALLQRPEALQGLGDLAHEGTAGDPGRQRNTLRGCGLIDAESDAKEVRVQVGGFHRVVDAGAAWQGRGHCLASASIFSTCGAPIAPGTRLPSANTSVGVPVILYFLPNSRLRARAPVSQLAAGAAWSRTIWSSQAFPLSLAHHMLRALSVESGPRI